MSCVIFVLTGLATNYDRTVLVHVAYSRTMSFFRTKPVDKVHYFHFLGVCHTSIIFYLRHKEMELPGQTEWEHFDYFSNIFYDKRQTFLQ